jgi:uncharacterized protein YndB with AHSA1/START domain
MKSQSVKFEQMVKATPAQAYYAFTNATAFREWLSDVASVRPLPGGRIYFCWNSGYYACGEYIELETDKCVTFTWRGRNDPASSQVVVNFNAMDGATEVRLEHILPGDGAEWESVRQEIEDGWRGSLENLASILETGEDIRITLRPMLGITIGDFNPEIAKKESIPVDYGIRLDGTLESMGAYAAGLRKGDLIVEMAGQEIRGFPELTLALQGKRAGDTVEVGIYRGSERMTVPMKLSRRQIPSIPASIADLGKALREQKQQLEAEIDEFFKDVTDEQAERRPQADEWNTKEIIAHLIHGERAFQLNICDIVVGEEQWTDDFGGNLDAQVRATVSAYPKLADLLGEYRRAKEETIALFENLPENFIERKGSYWRLAFNALDEPFHFHTHLDQMRAALVAG